MALVIVFLDTHEWDVHFNYHIDSLVLMARATLRVYVFFCHYFSISVLNQNFILNEQYNDIMMYTAYPEVVPILVYEPIPKYFPMAMNPKEEDHSEEEDPFEGTDDPIIDWDIDSNSSFYYSNSSAPSSKGCRISSRGCRHGRGHGCRF